MPRNFATKWSASYLASLTPEQRSSFLADLTPQQLRSLKFDWSFWARPEQRPPSGTWHTWLILAGRGAGKTKSGAEWVRSCACGSTPLAKGAYARFALVAETAADARDVMIEGPSGLLAIHPRLFRPTFEPSKRRLTWPNGAIAILYNATEPDQLRGPQHDAAWSDELAKWRYARETWDMLQFGLRVGADPRQAITTTPRPIPIIRDLLAREGQGVVLTRVRPTTTARISPRLSSKPSSNTMRAHASEGRNSMQNSLMTLLALFGRALSSITTAFQMVINCLLFGASSSASTPPRKPAPTETEPPKQELYRCRTG